LEKRLEAVEDRRKGGRDNKGIPALACQLRGSIDHRRKLELQVGYFAETV